MKIVMAEPLKVEVVTHVLGSMNHCSHCQVFIDGVGIGDKVHQADLESYPPEWMEVWQRLSDLIFHVTERFAGRLVIKLIDAQSPQAMWKAIRQGIRKYPAFLVGNEKYHGMDESEVVDLIERHLSPTP